MTTSALIVIAIILAAVAIVGVFIPRFPAAIAGWLGLLCMHFAGQPFCDSRLLLYWGIATGIVLALGFIQPKALTSTRKGHFYIAAGAIAGAVVGLLIARVVATIIIGSCIGVMLHAIAYNRTPKGPHLPVSSHEFIQYICAKGLPAVISCTMATIVIATVL